MILAPGIRRKRIDGSLSYDNAQSEYLGTGEFNAQLSFNSPLRDGDDTILNVLVARDFGSFVYAALGHGTPGFSTALFTKAIVTAGYDRVLGKKLVVRRKAQGQYSGNALHATEGIAFGGADYGCAFDTAAITADSGGGGLGDWRINVSWKLSLCRP